MAGQGPSCEPAARCPGNRTVKTKGPTSPDQDAAATSVTSSPGTSDSALSASVGSLLNVDLDLDLDLDLKNSHRACCEEGGWKNEE